MIRMLLCEYGIYKIGKPAMFNGEYKISYLFFIKKDITFILN
jgi:hypothetical protein